MKRLIPFICFAASFLVISCGNNSTKQTTEKQLPPNVKHIDYPVTGFTAISTGGVFDFFFVHADKESVFAEMDTSLLDAISFSNNNNSLVIESNGDISTQARWKDITINYKTIRTLTFEGASDVTFKDTLNTDTLFLTRSGVGKIILNVNCKVLLAEINGVGETIINGTAGYADIYTDNMSDTKAAGLKTDSLKIKQDGSNAIEVWAEKKLFIEVNNGGKVKYKGNPEIIGSNLVAGKDIEQIK